MMMMMMDHKNDAYIFIRIIRREKNNGGDHRLYVWRRVRRSTVFLFVFSRKHSDGN